jgi:hypothetical protein
LYIVHFHVINLRPQIVFGVLLLSAVYGKESKSDVKLEMGKLAESIDLTLLAIRLTPITGAPDSYIMYYQFRTPTQCYLYSMMELCTFRSFSFYTAFLVSDKQRTLARWGRLVIKINICKY